MIAPIAGIITERWGPGLPTTAGMAFAAGGLLLLTFSMPAIPTVAVALALAGLGFGLFTPANNSTVAGAGHEHQAGMVSGVLNMTRGIGTSLGVALAGATYALAISASNTHTATPNDASAGLRAAAILLAVLALIAASLSAAKDHPRASLCH